MSKNNSASLDYKAIYGQNIPDYLKQMIIPCISLNDLGLFSQAKTIFDMKRSIGDDPNLLRREQIMGYIRLMEEFKELDENKYNSENFIPETIDCSKEGLILIWRKNNIFIKITIHCFNFLQCIKYSMGDDNIKFNARKMRKWDLDKDKKIITQYDGHIDKYSKDIHKLINDLLS